MREKRRIKDYKEKEIPRINCFIRHFQKKRLMSNKAAKRQFDVHNEKYQLKIVCVCKQLKANLSTIRPSYKCKGEVG